MNIHEKLLNIQKSLKVPKSQYNTFGKYNYRSVEDILEAVKPLLPDQKASLRLTDEIVVIGDRYYVQSTAILTDIETGEFVSTKGYAKEEESKKGMDGSQITGGCSSYARKYALNGLFCIDDTKDSDFTNTHEKNQVEKVQASNQRNYNCVVCGNETPEKVAKFSHSKFGKILCFSCQKQ